MPKSNNNSPYLTTNKRVLLIALILIFSLTTTQLLYTTVLATTNSQNPIQILNIVDTSDKKSSITTNATNNEELEINIGKSINRELKGRESHRYLLKLETNQYLALTVEQKDTNVLLKLFDTNGNKILEVDSPNGKEGIEPLFFVSEKQQNYYLEIISLEEQGKAGAYALLINEAREATFDDRELIKARSLSEEAQEFRRQSKYDQAIKLVDQVLAIRERVLGTEHIDVAESLNDLGVLYKIKGNYEKAEPLYQRALEIREKKLGSEHLLVSNSLVNLASLYQEKAEYKKAESLYQKTLEIREKILKADDPLMGQIFNSLGKFYFVTGDYKKAKPLLEKGFEIREKKLNPDNVLIADSLDNLANVYRVLGEYEKVEPFYQKALEIRKKKLSPDHPDIATNLFDLGYYYYYVGEYEKAESLYQKALEIREKKLGPNHPFVIGILRLMVLLYRKEGEYAKAEQYVKKAFDARKNYLKNSSSNSPGNFLDIADLYYLKGEYGKAELFYKKALDIQEKQLGLNSTRSVDALASLGIIYRCKGEYEKAEALYQKCLKIYESKLGTEHVGITIIFNNLAFLAYCKGEYEKAESLHKRALELREKKLASSHYLIAQSLGNLALVYQAKGEYEKAEPLYKRALEIKEKKVGIDSPLTANVLSNLALLYQAKGEYEKAEPLYKRALEIREKKLGLEHPLTATLLNNLAHFYIDQGQMQEAANYQIRGNESREAEISNNLVSGSENEKLLYLELTSKEQNQALSLHLQFLPESEKAAKMALTLLLRRKGRALDVMTDAISKLRKSTSAEDQQLLNSLSDKKKQFSQLNLKGSDKESVKEYKKKLDELQQQIEDLENEVSTRSAEVNQETQPITLEAVEKEIPSNSMLVEFASYSPYDKKTKKYLDKHYAVYLLDNKGEIHFADLGESSKIDQSIKDLRQELLNKNSNIEKEVKPKAKAVYNLILKPVEKILNDKHHLLISPDSSLNLLPFEALVNEKDKYLVEEYEISYLTSGRDLLRLQNKMQNKNSAQIIANPDFAEGEGPKVGKVAFKPLKALTATAQEAEKIKTKLIGAKVLVQQDANKEALLNMRHPSILHIATHGFFLDNLPVSVNELERIAERDDLNEPIEGIKLENPLLRSGLFLAQANQNSEKGVLTALEVASLDLLGTKLVVLSACDTAVGEIKDGDGVYGLRRALVLAGSESQVMSLWPVSDAGTRDLMIGYYDGLQKGEGRSSAIRKIRLDLLKRPDRSHPYYWASFIQSGEWANLDEKR